MISKKKQQLTLQTQAIVSVSLPIEISVVLPCLNEEATVGKCVQNALRWIGNKRGEVIVVDNGCTDSSVRVAKAAGARVIRQTTKGYGAAIYKGLQSAKGKYIIIADADLSYDLRHLTPFLKKLQDCDVVIGNRFGYPIPDNAMPWLHRYVGNPVLTAVANILFGTHLSDYHSGLRAIKKSAVGQLHLRCPGMEFASEMIVRSALNGLVIDEVPIQYQVDGRNRKSHIRTFRDGWRHLRFLILFAPSWVFFFPAVLILLCSISLLLWMIGNSLHLGRLSFGVHTMLLDGALVILGLQLLNWSFCVDVFAKTVELPVRAPKILEKLQRVGFEMSLLIGAVVFLVGIGLCSWTFYEWSLTGFGSLDPEKSMRFFIPGIIFVILGVQTFFANLFLGLMKFEIIE